MIVGCQPAEQTERNSVSDSDLETQIKCLSPGYEWLRKPKHEHEPPYYRTVIIVYIYIYRPTADT